MKKKFVIGFYCSIEVIIGSINIHFHALIPEQKFEERLDGKIYQATIILAAVDPLKSKF